MRKTLLTLLALVVTLTAAPQTNLALNRPAFASSVSDENATLTPDKAVDGDAGTKWASNYGTADPSMTDEQKAAQWFYVDLGAEVEVNTLKITWDNQAPHKFAVRYATADPAADPKTAGTAVLTEQAGTDNHQDVYQFDAAVTARYIILDLQERGPWGYGINELEVYDIDYAAAELTSISVSPKFVKVGEPTTLTFSAIDNFNNAMTGITYTVGGEPLANPFTATAGGLITITGTDAAGHSAVTTVYALADADAPAAPAGVFVPVYTADEAATWESVYNGGAVQGTELTLGTAKAMPYEAARCVFFTNAARWADIYNVNINPAAERLGELHVSLFAATAATGKVVLEQTHSIAADNAFSLPAGQWTDVVVDLDGETFIKAMSVRMDNADDILLANIYFTEAEDNPDAGKVASLMVDPQLVAVGVETILTLTAADNKGVAITEGVTYTADGLVGNQLTAPAAGALMVTAATHEGAETATATVYAVAAPIRTDGAGDIEILQSGKSQSGSGTDWEGGYKPLPNLVYADHTVAYHAQNVKTLYLTNPGLSADDLSSLNTFHLDLFSTVDDAACKVVLEGINAEAAFEAKAGQWVSVDVPFEGGAAASSWIKIKFSGEGAEVLVDNVYFTKTVDTEAPVISDATAEPTYTGAIVTVVATDNSNSLISYTFTAGGVEKTATAASGDAAEVTFAELQLGTAYTVTIVATDAAGNASEPRVVNFTTKSLPAIPGAPAPTDDADYVTAFYSDVYTVPAAGVQFMNWHAVDVLAEEVAASDAPTDQLYRIYTKQGFSYYGLQLDQSYDLTGVVSIHLDIWSDAAATIGFSPINQTAEPHTAQKTLTLNEGWNSFAIAVSDFSSAMDITNVDQLEFFDAPAGLVVAFDNIYFLNSVPTGIRVAAQQPAERTGAYYSLDGRRVSQPAKGLYIHNGRKVIVK